MARHSSLFFFFFLALFVQHLHAVVSLPTLPRRSLEPAAEQWQPMQCAPQSLIPSCNSYLYVTPQGRSLSEIASDFKGNASLIQPIKRLSGSEDLLIPVPCMCEAINATVNALFHDTGYEAIQNDISDDINSNKFSGLAWNLTAGLNKGDTITVHLLCGCSSTAPEGVLSYTVQPEDTLSNIATLFSSGSREILSLNPAVRNPDFIKPGWVLFIPMGVAASSNKSESLLLILHILNFLNYIKMDYIECWCHWHAITLLKCDMQYIFFCVQICVVKHHESSNDLKTILCSLCYFPLFVN